ncbi:MAG: DUF92 domain-containing protein [Anaerolineae bacterium]|nr:DUF92 domain-containing protein [Anaerolineae bacterium]
MVDVQNLLIQLPVGIVLSGLIAFLAYKRNSLSKSGVAGAMLVGTAIFGFGGWAWGMTLIAFFVLSTLLSHYKEREKEHIAAEKFDKGGTRDFGQAAANGGAGALAALAYIFVPDPLILAAFAGIMATVNADTWATEIGVLSTKPPRLITNFEPVEPGTSGGVTWLGTLATIGGAIAIGLSLILFLALDGIFGGAGFSVAGGAILSLLAAAAVGGLAGSLFDSLLGATVQSIYFCPTCEKETEKRLHTCGTQTDHARGWHWLNNDLVNFISSIVGGLIAGLVFWLM